jgi:hypothetical protein
MNIAGEPGDGDLHTEPFFEELGIAVNEVIGPAVALVNKRVMHIDALDAGIAVIQRREIRVILPERRRASADIGLKLAGMGRVQVSHGGREH